MREKKNQGKEERKEFKESERRQHQKAKLTIFIEINIGGRTHDEVPKDTHHITPVDLGFSTWMILGC